MPITKDSINICNFVLVLGGKLKPIWPQTAFETLPDACMEPTATQRGPRPRNRAAKERQQGVPGAPTGASLGLFGALLGRPCAPKKPKKFPRPPQDAQKACQGSQTRPGFAKNVISNQNRTIYKTTGFALFSDVFGIQARCKLVHTPHKAV